MSRGQDFSKVGFDPLVDYETDLMGCDRVKRMSVFCMGKDKFFVELVSIMYTYTFMSVCTSSPCKLSFLWGLSLKSHCLIDQIQTSHHFDALFFLSLFTTSALCLAFVNHVLSPLRFSLGLLIAFWIKC